MPLSTTSEAADTRNQETSNSDRHGGSKENERPTVDQSSTGDSNSSGEYENCESENEGRSAKKRKINRIDELKNPLRMRLTEGAFFSLRARIATEHGFPDDNMKAVFARESFSDSYDDFKRRGIDLHGTSSSISLEEADLVRAIQGRYP